MDPPLPYPPAGNPPLALSPVGAAPPLPSAPLSDRAVEGPYTPLLAIIREWETGPAAGTRSKHAGTPPESRAFPLWAYGTLDEHGQQPLEYWPFSPSDLYNWKTHNPSFADNPQALTALLDSILFSHQPTWDDCQQLLQALFTTKERQHSLLEARKNVPGADGRPSLLPNDIDAGFPLTRPNWDYNTAEDKEHLKVYCQALMAGLRGAARQPTNLAKVRKVIQGLEESPSAFLE